MLEGMNYGPLCGTAGQHVRGYRVYGPLDGTRGG